MINISIFIPSLVISVFQLVGSLIILYQGYKIGFHELVYLGLAFLLQGSIPMINLVFEFFKSEKYLETYTMLYQIATILSGLAVLAFWYIILYLNRYQIRPYHVIMIISLPFSTGMLMYSLKIDLDFKNNHWDATHDPLTGLVLFGILICGFLIEIAFMFWASYQDSHEKEKPNRLILFVASIIALFTGVMAIAERLLFPESIGYFYFFNTLSVILIAYAVWINPLSIIPPNFDLKFMIISDKESGVLIHSSVFDYGLIDKENSTITALGGNNLSYEELEPNYYLFSSAMSGVLMMVNEVINQNLQIKKFSYLDLEILVEENNRIIAYLALSKELKYFRQLMKKLIHNLDDLELFDINHYQKLPGISYTNSMRDRLDQRIKESFGLFV